jgi:acetyltransferase-like isoleucine patch superfamily enzyme
VVSDNSFYNRDELQDLGLKQFGRNVKVSRKAVFYGSEFISIGADSRIDDFCLFSASSDGEIIIGKNVHISAGVYLYGSAGILIGDFVGISAGCKLFSESEDYSGEHLTNPTIPKEFKDVDSNSITLDKHSLVGAGSILLPGTTLLEGTAIGAMSLVSGRVGPWGIFAGIPARLIKSRSKNLLALEKNYTDSKSIS